MRIVDSGVITQSAPGTDRAVYTFPALVQLSNGALLMSCRRGTGKDSADEWVELYRSTDGGRRWTRVESDFPQAQVEGAASSFRLCYLTEMDGGNLLAASLWIDRETHPGAPLFNPQTEGCLPMGIFLADSVDGGITFSAWRKVELPAEIGPPSLTNPLTRLNDGSLLMTVETNKHYHDASKWYQRVVCLRSRDGGLSWDAPTDAGCDPTGRIFNWDQRVGITPIGILVSFSWVYNTLEGRYRNILRRVSSSAGMTWSEAQDIGIADQAGHPAVLSDGQIVLAWLDRFGSGSIRARVAADAYSGFDPQSEVLIYAHDPHECRMDTVTAATLDDMSIWSYGLPYAETLDNGDVMAVYYSGDQHTMDIHYARLALD